MSVFKYSMLCLLMSVSMYVEAVSTTTLISSQPTPGSQILLFAGNGSGNSYDDTHNGKGAAVVRSAVGQFTDTWEVNLESGKTASISFTENPHADYFKINDFKVNGVQVLDNTVLSLAITSPGINTFTITGFAIGSEGGVYSVGTTVVPAPAAAWLMGTALAALLSFGRRKREALS